MTTVDGKKVLMIIARENFRDEEYEKPRQILQNQGASVTVASTSTDPAKGMLGATVQPDVLLRDVNPADWDAVVFVGGSGASEYWNNPIAHQVAKSACGANKVVGAICIAPVTLAKAGLLRGKKATVFSSQASQLKARGASYTGKDVERDGNLITADGPASAAKFGNALVAALSGK